MIDDFKLSIHFGGMVVMILTTGLMIREGNRPAAIIGTFISGLLAAIWYYLKLLRDHKNDR